MPDISKITLPNGVTYDIKDATARSSQTVEVLELTSDDTVTTIFEKLDVLSYDLIFPIYVSKEAINLLTNGDYTARDSFGTIIKKQIVENDATIDTYTYSLTYGTYAMLILYQKEPTLMSIGNVSLHRMVDDYGDQIVNGAKTFKDNVIMRNHQTVPKLYFGGSNMPTSSAVIYVNGCATSDNDYGNAYFSFYEYGPSSDPSVRSDRYERYSLPAADTNRTGHGTFDILTSKNSVTVAQGGTGASNASDARDNLGLGTMAVRNLTATSVAANKSVSIESVPNGALIVAYVNNSNRYFGYKRGNANMCPFINEGSITVSSSAGTVTIANGTSSTCYYGIIGG